MSSVSTNRILGFVDWVVWARVFCVCAIPDHERG